METHWSEVVHNLLESAAIIVGGAWIIYRFGISREQYPKLQLDVDISLIGVHQDEYLVELCATVENKGSVRQTIKDFRFDLRALMTDTPVTTKNDYINNQVEFSKTLILDKEWVPQQGNKAWYAAFIDGGIVQKYRYITSIPKTTSYLLFYTKFSPKSLGQKRDITEDLVPGEGSNDLKRGDFYHVQKTFSVEKLIESNKKQTLQKQE